MTNLLLYKGNEESSNDASTAEISRLTVPINSFVQMVFLVTVLSEFSSTLLTMSLNKSATAPDGSLPY
jgi:hypothetical protein